jgi:hypothetical protein
MASLRLEEGGVRGEWIVEEMIRWVGEMGTA